MKAELRSHRLAIAALVGVAGLVAASCGSTASPTTSSSSSSSAGLPTKATVNIPEADRFEPFMLEVAKGATVTFMNKDADAHTVVSMPTDPINFKLLVLPGKSASYTFAQPGIYGYYCDAHSQYDPTTGLIKANKAADAYPISMYGMILVAGDGLPLMSGKATVVMPDADRFEPLAIAVRKGTQVTWENLDSEGHTVLADPGDSAQFKFVVPGEGRASFTFDKPGIYPFFCDAHALWNAELKRVQARPGSSEYPAAMEGVVFVLP